MKKCNTCNIEKPLEGFFKHKRMKDGYTNICKACRTEMHNESMKDPEWVEKERTRGRTKHQRLYAGSVIVDPLTKKKAMDNYYNKFPEKKQAAAAIRKDSKDPGSELHHWSYNKEHWKDCIKLDPKTHKLAHRYITYDPERMMYRISKTGELLDTKEKHETFIKSLVYVP